jgi:hypothetical protein
MAGSEKRRHPRHKVQKDAHCYIDGFRVDVRTEDLSLGGMFLATPGPRPEPETQVAVVFGEHAGASHPTFLFGRVVRVQDEPVRGVGILWEKAVTVGSLEEHAVFLETTLGLTRNDVARRSSARASGNKWVYHFPPPETTLAEEEIVVEAVPPAVVSSEGDDAAGTGTADAEPGAIGTEPGTGSITSLIEKREVQSPASIDATLAWRSASLSVRISRIGTAGMFVVTPFMPVARNAAVAVRFLTSSDGRPLVFECTCHVVGVDPGAPGLELEIESVDEGGADGMYKSFLKRLQFWSLAGA